MQIRIISDDNLLKKSFKSSDNNYDCVFIDWIPTTSNNPKKLLIQTNILEEAIKKNVKTIIFDRYLSLAKREILWIQKHKNVILCEPALINRAGFIYLPFWTEILNLETIPFDDKKRNITLYYKGNMLSRVKEFEKYYVWSKTWFPNINVAYTSPDIDKTKNDEYQSKGLIETSNDYSDSEFTIAIGSEMEYKAGYLDPCVFDAIKSNCVPIIPDEHRFYKSFRSLEFDGFKNWYSTHYDMIGIGLVWDFYNCVSIYYPEMKINSVVDQIKSLLAD